MKESAAALVLMFVALSAVAAGVIASGPAEVTPARTPAVAVAAVESVTPAAENWAPIGVPPASFQITIAGHPHGPLNGSATLTRSNPALLNYGGYINGIQCLIYIEPQQNFLHFNAMLVGATNFRFIASGGSAPPQTGTFPLNGGGTITIQ